MSREITLEDDKGKHMKAMVVFASVIKYLKDHLLNSFRERKIMKLGVNAEEIYWVLTVPAIWSDPAKQFMREAAENVSFDLGLKSKILRLF